MITIAEAISELLLTHSIVVVPGLGAFLVKPKPAQVNVVTNRFSRPNADIVFDTRQREENDLIARYLAECNSITIEEAQRQLVVFVSDCFRNLKAGKPVVLKNIGSLSYDWAQDVVLEQESSINYNAEAFGLSDFEAKVVCQGESREEIRKRIAKEQRDKNTAMSVDEEEMQKARQEDYPSERNRRRRGVWLLVVLFLFVVGAAVFLLWYFRIMDGFWNTSPQPKKWQGVKTERLRSWPLNTGYLPSVDTEEAVSQPADSLEQRMVEYQEFMLNRADSLQSVAMQQDSMRNVSVEETTALHDETEYLIIGGCYSSIENAEVYVNSLREKGYQRAFVNKRGRYWDAVFDRFSAMDDAKEALVEIHASIDAKAWILTRKQGR